MKFSTKLLLGLLCAQAAYITAADDLDLADNSFLPDLQPWAEEQVAAGDELESRYDENTRLEQKIEEFVEVIKSESYTPEEAIKATLWLLNKEGFIEHIYKQAATQTFSPAVNNMSKWLSDAIEELESLASTDQQERVVADIKAFFGEVGGAGSEDQARDIWEHYNLDERFKSLFGAEESPASLTSVPVPTIHRPAPPVPVSAAPIVESEVPARVPTETVLKAILRRVQSDAVVRQKLRSGKAELNVTLSQLRTDPALKGNPISIDILNTMNRTR